MKKIFFDTNVVLDILLGRSGAAEALQITELSCKDQFVRIYISSLTVANCAYVMRSLGIEQVKSMCRDLLRSYSVIPLGDMQISDAATADASDDFEDMLQIMCAESKECDFIITNNTKDFRRYSNIPVYTPSEFLQKI